MQEGVVKVDRRNGSVVTFRNVYHVPGLKKNMVSISQITSCWRYVLFGSDDVKSFENLKHFVTDVLFSGKKKESLFVMSASEAHVDKTSKNIGLSLACSLRTCWLMATNC